MDFYYKLLNYLVQGSSADVTKEGLIRYDSHPKRESRFLVTVYDEINISTPSLKGLSAKAKQDCAKREMQFLRESMEGIPGIDVPMLSDGKASDRNWAELKSWKEN
jgi:DNA polymerase I-like protein with 3'-5' exonuclease and polymerase domains